jgi:hypothetical protein
MGKDHFTGHGLVHPVNFYFDSPPDRIGSIINYYHCSVL